MVIEPALGTVGSVGRCRVLLENEICISIKLVSRRKHEVLYNLLVDAALTLDFRKHSGPTPADDMAAQTITDCGNFTLDFKNMDSVSLRSSSRLWDLDLQIKYNIYFHL